MEAQESTSSLGTGKKIFLKKTDHTENKVNSQQTRPDEIVTQSINEEAAQRMWENPWQLYTNVQIA